MPAPTRQTVPVLADARPGVSAVLYSAIVPTIPAFPQWEGIWSAIG